MDSVIGLLGMLNVLAGNRPDTAPADPWITRWEGWVLGQVAQAVPCPRGAPPPAPGAGVERRVHARAGQRG